MNPGNPELIDRLAAEYVLGTLRGPARRRFERWRADAPHVDQRCCYWEEHLMHVAKGLKPVQPPAHVWPAIRKRLNLTPHLLPPPCATTLAPALASSSTLAVSIEPPGGSPTGQPTGDVVFVASLRKG